MTKSVTTRHRGFVIGANGRYRIDRRKKLSSIVPNEIILQEMQAFFAEYYSSDRGGALLDVGAGLKPYSVVYEPYFERCISTDVEHSQHDIQVDVIASADDLPFEDRTFDCILCTEVLEHCPDPDQALREMCRVLKPGGRIFLTTPFLVALHEMPFDFYRYTPSAFDVMARDAGLTIESQTTKGDYGAVLMSFAQFPWTKLWQVVSSATRLKLYRPANPFLLLPVVVPQLVYLWYWRRARRIPHGLLGRIYRKLEYVTLGYVTVLRRCGS
jgi:SAM-dependent methyltransferase